MSLDLDPRTRPSGPSVVATPRLRTIGRRLRFWGVLLAVLGIVTALVIAIGGIPTTGPTLSAANADGNGAKALIEVLRQNGVHVSTPTTLAAAERAVAAAPGTTTLAIIDEYGRLDRARLGALTAGAAEIVLVDPDDALLGALAPEVFEAGVVPSRLRADCGLRPVQRAGTVSANTTMYGYTVDGTVASEKCLGSGGGVYSLIRLAENGTPTTVLGTGSALRNDTIAVEGDAALGLGVFGAHPNLVWFRPAHAEGATPNATGPVAPPLPGWVGLIELLAIVVLAAAIAWRGRRFGPLVIERMPAVVRASETMEGRARLYARSSDRLHALDALRIGSVGRLAVLCGLPHTATVEDIIGSVCALTGRSRDEVRGILLDDVPRTDRQLVQMSDALVALEREVDAAARPS
ncbi:DUF4350 domain-containing protein [Galbitalea soli]|uniref:DUF4350 domain-containing protein n=1 Tax=Galbitalea soli TaxID=1268042 RepID=A0A7C9PMM0_9MICO|nr:DUF4350 domain-containing protein [Galbitalea soli]NEM90829.1 hypothetical protein [Galbitalea soli]NYJ31549.1 hypothetical protein [Galbitalea soli]